MSKPHQVVSTRDVAEHFGISANHLIKVAKSLTQAGWLVSTRGASGGIALAPNTPNLKLGDVVRYTENLNIVECFDLETNTCPIHRGCQLKIVLYHAQKEFLKVLDQFKVEDLILPASEIKSLLRALSPPA